MDKLRKIKLLAMDVDGVLTDGGMVYVGESNESKVFNAQDGLGIRLALVSGLKVVWVTGNESPAVARRAEDVGVTALFQGARYKAQAVREIAERYGLSQDEIAYVGDDLNDLPAFEVAGLSIAVDNAAPEVKRAADFVTKRSGGAGAVREIIEMILKSQDRWQEAVKSFLEELEREQAEGKVARAVS